MTVGLNKIGRMSLREKITCMSDELKVKDVHISVLLRNHRKNTIMLRFRHKFDCMPSHRKHIPYCFSSYFRISFSHITENVDLIV